MISIDSIIVTTALSTVVTCLSLQKVYGEPSGKFIKDDSPQIYARLWEIASEDPDEFSIAVSNFLANRYVEDATVKEKWALFISYLSRNVMSSRGSVKKHSSLSELGDRFTMENMISSFSSDSLQVYQISVNSQRN